MRRKINSNQVSSDGLKRNPDDLEDNFLHMSYQRSIWSELSPKERLRKSWSMRRLLKDKRAIHDKKLFPNPYSIQDKIPAH